MEGKVWYKSKSMLFGMITGILGAICVAVPAAKPLNDFLAAHVAEIGLAWGVLATVLRTVTKDKIVLSE